MSTADQPLKDSGDHPPFVSYMLTCTANDGEMVTLSNDELTVTYFFKQSKEAAYFEVGKQYVVLAFAVC